MSNIVQFPQRSRIKAATGSHLVDARAHIRLAEIDLTIALEGATADGRGDLFANMVRALEQMRRNLDEIIASDPTSDPF